MALPYLPYMLPMVPARPHGNLAYAELEPRPLFPRASQTTRNFCRVFIRAFAATVGIVMLVCFFVLRYAYQYPELEDNFTMILCSFTALFMIGFSFLLTHDDGEAYDGEAYA